MLIHPEMTLPDGSTTTGSDYIVHRRIRPGQLNSCDACGFHEDYEPVEGGWAFQIWYRGDMLVEQKFTTYWQDEGVLLRRQISHLPKMAVDIGIL